MARDFAREFYKSKSWKSLRKAYVESRHGLCERCWAKGVASPGEIVHHKIHLSPANINDPEITLNPANLELLCRDCHAIEHSEGDRPLDRVAFDEEGNVVKHGV